MKKVKIKENYLERIPCKNPKFSWNCDEKNLVTIEIENKGIFNRIAQMLFKKPKVSYIHLDELGSFVWLKCDGNTNIIDIGKAIQEEFEDRVQPLYERLVKYFQTLYNCGFIKWGSNN